MSFFWARFQALLARVHRPARRLVGTKTGVIGLPDQGRQIRIDNLADRDHGAAAASFDIATRPRPRVRMAVDFTTNRLDRAAVGHAHTMHVIERDARTGETSVGRRGASPRGRRMRRDCPNDRRPTRPAAHGSCTCPSAGRSCRRVHATWERTRH